MSSRCGYVWTNGLYGLFLGLWFGALVMLAVSAAVTFATVRSAYPQWSAMQQNELAGGIVGNIIRGPLAMIEATCAVIVGVCTFLQCTVFADWLCRRWVNWLRVILIAAPIGIMIANQAVITPKMFELRRGMFNEQNQNRNADQRLFDRYHKLTERLTGAATFMLGGALLISPLVLTPPGGRDEQDG